ncbi:hypothetical protein [Streptomyces sp. NPDC002221]|uniref:hypothetical protein n=1 Tax=Streptomyces sp. NPDC002221 TaxID=3364639 RepID=UPI0036C3364F
MDGQHHRGVSRDRIDARNELPITRLPGVGAVAESLKTGKAVVKTIGTGAKASYKASVGIRRAGLTFLAETGGAGASEATKVFNYIGTKGAKAVGATAKSGQIVGKILQGSINLWSHSSSRWLPAPTRPTRRPASPAPP